MPSLSQLRHGAVADVDIFYCKTFPTYKQVYVIFTLSGLPKFFVSPVLTMIKTD